MTLFMTVIIQSCLVVVRCQEDPQRSYGAVASPSSKSIGVAAKLEAVLQPVSSPDNGTQYNTQPGFEREYVSFSGVDDERTKASDFAVTESDGDVKEELVAGPAQTETIDLTSLQKDTEVVSDSQWSELKTAKQNADTSLDSSPSPSNTRTRQEFDLAPDVPSSSSLLRPSVLQLRPCRKRLPGRKDLKQPEASPTSRSSYELRTPKRPRIPNAAPSKTKSQTNTRRGLKVKSFLSLVNGTKTVDDADKERDEPQDKGSLNLSLRERGCLPVLSSPAVQDRATCPFRFISSFNKYRIPGLITTVHCMCEGSRCSSRKGFRCVQIRKPMNMMRRLGRAYTEVLEELPVACVCAYLAPPPQNIG